jgi:hypothetical protein
MCFFNYHKPSLIFVTSAVYSLNAAWRAALGQCALLPQANACPRQVFM